MPLCNHNAPYTVYTNLGGRAITILPSGVDISRLVDITCFGDMYSKFMTPEGHVMDCAVYARELEAWKAAQPAPEQHIRRGNVWL